MHVGAAVLCVVCGRMNVYVFLTACLHGPAQSHTTNTDHNPAIWGLFTWQDPQNTQKQTQPWADEVFRSLGLQSALCWPGELSIVLVLCSSNLISRCWATLFLVWTREASSCQTDQETSPPSSVRSTKSAELEHHTDPPVQERRPSGSPTYQKTTSPCCQPEKEVAVGRRS